MSRRPQDHYGHRARREGYPARSVYKLQAIDERYRLFHPGMRVLDLGAAPGSWTLYVAERLRGRGQVIAVDLQRLALAPSSLIQVLQMDVFAIEVGVEPFLRESFDVVLSDMAPSTTGNRTVDQARSFNLFMRALEVAQGVLKEGGAFVGKIFQGPDFEEARAAMRAAFAEVRAVSYTH
ncbi:MAG: RlmE family RNA methyltransferase, partial [Deltaproteobacteria bacterium]|nr:RlmE family RNA methyltransferase [Deltaproteobacteria bacterium]